MLRTWRNNLPRPWRIGIEIAIFALLTGLVVVLINAFVFRNYSVIGPSMNPTLSSGDRLFVNKLGPTFDKLRGASFVPSRGDITVFKNPLFEQGQHEEFIVKRVIGLPGERVVVKDGQLTVYPSQSATEGFNPDEGIVGPTQPVSGNIDIVVPHDQLFVVGDNREGKFSFDSRNGLSTVPLSAVEGVVVWRIYPLNAWRSF